MRNTLLALVQTDAEFKMANRLLDYLQDRPITFESVTEFIITTYGFERRHFLEIKELKRILKHIGIEYPSEYGTLLIRIPVDRTEFLHNLRDVCSTHSVYAYYATRLIIHDNVLHWSIDDVDRHSLNNIYPKWIRLIWDRQRRLCQNAALDGSIFFFSFVNDGKDVRHTSPKELTNTGKTFNTTYEYNLSTYIDQYRDYTGMTTDGVHVVNFKTSLENIISKRRERNYGRIVRVTDLNQDTVFYGVCFGEIEEGIYVVIGQNDKLYYVPFYRLDMPSSDEQFEWALSKDYYRQDGKFMGKWTDIRMTLNMEKYVSINAHNH